MTYEIAVREGARKSLDALDKPVKARIVRAIGRPAETPRPGQATRLVGDPRTWRIRVGDWRVLYEIDDAEFKIVILDVKHRSTVYG